MLGDDHVDVNLDIVFLGIYDLPRSLPSGVSFSLIRVNVARSHIIDPDSITPRSLPGKHTDTDIVVNCIPLESWPHLNLDMIPG